MTTVVGSYWKLLVQPAAARNTITKHGNEIYDRLSTSRFDHTALYNLSWWSQPTLACYTPTPHFHAAHSVADGDAFYPAPALKHYPVVKWKLTSGQVSVRTVQPDGAPPVSMVKVMPAAAVVGSSWSMKTSDLGLGWEAGFGSSGAGATPIDGSTAVLIARGVTDSPDAPTYDLSTETPTDFAEKNRTGRPGDVRVTVGNLWSVRIPGDGSEPTFEKQVGRAANGGLLWDRLHTFTGALKAKIQGVDQWLVAFCVIEGRLAVSVNGREINDTSYIYYEQDPRFGGLKQLGIPSVPVTVSGLVDGAPVYVGIRRIGWGGYGQFTNTMDLEDACVVGALGAQPTEGTLTAIPNYVSSPLSGSITLVAQTIAPTKIAYTATVYASNDDRVPGVIRSVFFRSDRVATVGVESFIDYGPAITTWDEDQAEPDFSGAGGTRGSHAMLQLEFDPYLLDKIAAAAGSNWHTDLAAYSPAAWIVGNQLSDGTTMTFDESTSLQGFLEQPDDAQSGFNDGKIRRVMSDYSVLIKEPSGFIDRRYAPLDVINPSDVEHIYGWEAIRYILSKAIDPIVGSAIRVYMPLGWPALFEAILGILTTNSLPGNDVPLWNPPYGKYAGEWMKEVAGFDFAAFYFAGKVPIYGQYDQIVANQPTHDVYDGTDDAGNIVGSMPDAQISWAITAAASTFATDRDYNRWIVWGTAPGGVDGGDDARKLGAPMIEAESRDYARITGSWERTKLFQGGQFYDGSAAALYVRTVKALSGGAKAAAHYNITIPHALPGVYWGHKLQLHGVRMLAMHGKTLRVYKMSRRGDASRRKVVTTLSVLEII